MRSDAPKRHAEAMSVLVAAASLAILHAVGSRLTFIRYVPRSQWLSVAGGISVAYVFLHLIPEIAATEETLGETIGGLEDGGILPYVLALVGVTMFYAVEVSTRHHRRPEDEQDGRPDPAFLLSMTSYFVYNALIAYLLHERAEEGWWAVAAFTVALGLHFLVNDFALRESHRRAYQSIGRWALIAAIAIGSVAGYYIEVAQAARGATVAFIGGGVILNVLKEELPAERESSLAAFVLGAGLYGLLLLAIG